MKARAAQDYSEIDRHALAAPRSAEASVSALADYLTRPAAGSREQVRALFRWITENIAYDTAPGSRRALVRHAMARHRTPTGSGSAETLARRVAVCGGIAGLFESLARAAGIEAVTIVGYSKGRGYTVGRAFRPPGDHAWNAVRLEGEWHLLDATWGGGAFAGRTYRRAFDGHYFLTPPEVFIHDHFPEEPAWQLLERPFTLRAFENLPLLKPAFFRGGLVPERPQVGRIVANGTARLSFGAPPGLRAHVELRQGGRRLAASSVFVQREKGKLVVRAAPPRGGSYILRLFVSSNGGGRERPPVPGETTSETGSETAGEGGDAFEWAADYILRAAGGAGEAGGFPRIHGAFAASGACLEEPMEWMPRAGHRRRFRITVPGAEAVVVAGKGLWQPLEREGELFRGSVEIPGGGIKIAAKFSGGRSEYDVLLAYAAR